MKNKIILIIIILLIIPISFNEVRQYNLKKLKKETLEISEALVNFSQDKTQINIDKSIEINDQIYKTRGIGKAFVENDNVTVVLSYKGYCSVKVPGINEVALSKSKCQNLELLNNVIIPIVEKDGLTKVDNKYVYDGDSDNYLLFNNEYFNILSFENNQIKIKRSENIKGLNEEDVLSYLNRLYSNNDTIISIDILNEGNIYPVLTLKDNTKIIAGIGTKDNPYIILK